MARCMGKNTGFLSRALIFDHKAVINRKKKVIKLLSGGIKSTLKANGVELISGTGVICSRENDESPFIISVGSDIYEGTRLLVATGSSPAVPPIKGLEEGLERGFCFDKPRDFGLDGSAGKPGCDRRGCDWP